MEEVKSTSCVISRLHDVHAFAFGSDNNSGCHPLVIEALALANSGHVPSYGGDPYTQQASLIIKRHFGPDAQFFPVCTGTGANVISLAAISPPYGAVIASSSSHAVTDECGAPEKLVGVKFYTIDTHDGKLTPQLIAREIQRMSEPPHKAKPTAVSITQPTELGALYTVSEVRAIADQAHASGLKLHMDGARLCNAAAALNCTLAALTTEAGVDILSFGMTKNGALMAESVVVLKSGAAEGLDYIRKMCLHGVSKQRFFSVQFIAMLEGDLWLQSARHANAMALRIAEGVKGVEGIQLSRPVEVNAVFARVHREIADAVRTSFDFYTWEEETDEVRWMTSFDTTEANVDAFLQVLRLEVEKWQKRK